MRAWVTVEHGHVGRELAQCLAQPAVRGTKSLADCELCDHESLFTVNLVFTHQQDVCESVGITALYSLLVEVQ